MNKVKLDWRELEDVEFEPDDTNETQSFDLTDANEDERRCNALKLSFGSSTDFYDRVTIYQLEVWGDEEQ